MVQKISSSSKRFLKKSYERFFKSLQKIKKINSNEFLQTILFIYFSKIVTELVKIRHRKTDLQNAYIYICACQYKISLNLYLDINETNILCTLKKFTLNLYLYGM